MMMIRRCMTMQFLPLIMSTIFRLNHVTQVVHGFFCHHHESTTILKLATRCSFMSKRHNNNNKLIIINSSFNRYSVGNPIVVEEEEETCAPMGLARHSGSMSTRLFMAIGNRSSRTGEDIGYWRNGNGNVSFLGKRFISTTAAGSSSSSLTRLFSSRSGEGDSNNSNNGRRRRRPSNRRSSPPPPIPLPGHVGRGNFRELINVGVSVFVIKKEHQRSGVETQGSVMRLLTKSPHHPRGIKVMLNTGEVGRVTRIVGDDGEGK